MSLTSKQKRRVENNLIQAGDLVTHPRLGHLYVLGVNRDTGQACLTGWLPSMALLAELTLVGPGSGITPEERAWRLALHGADWEGEPEYDAKHSQA